LSERGLEGDLRALLAERYHDKHPFNLRLHGGACSPQEIRRWVRNRFYYQTRIPIKDGLILTKAEDRDFRRGWIRRIHDHDGDAEREGGIELWLRLAEAVGLERDEVASLRGVLPGVRRACDAYVEFVASHDLLESVASSLTELSAGAYLGERAAAFREHYDWIAPEGLAYFLSRTTQAPRDAQEGLAFVLEHATDAESRARCLKALERKCEILWALLDAVAWAGHTPSLAAGARLRKDPAGAGELVVLPERAVRLSGSGPGILRSCQGEATVEEIALQQSAQHPEAADAQADAFEFLLQMQELGVLEMRE
jgi:pyrroloquinoline-quinone synthase